MDAEVGGELGSHAARRVLALLGVIGCTGDEESLAGADDASALVGRARDGWWWGGEPGSHAARRALALLGVIGSFTGDEESLAGADDVIRPVVH